MSQAKPVADTQDDQLNRAIEELRGVLHSDGPAPAGGAPAGAAFTPQAGAAMGGASTSIIMNIPVEVEIVLGSTEMPVSDLMALQKGSTVALNRRVGEPVDVVVNGRRIARGEITVLEHDPSRFGIRLTEIVTPVKPA